MLAAGLARAGVVVVSGLARGTDAAAHEGALAGGTVAVLGCGIDVAYPPEHRALQERIAGQGLVLTEFPPGTPPLRHHFPQRNRLIAALSRGVVVVEASARSGALITANRALDLGREVFAVPGPIGRRTSEGTNALLRDGARIVLDATDILAELGLPAPEPDGAGAAPPAGLSGPALAVWQALSAESRHVDEVAARAGLDPAAALRALLELELLGCARQTAGMRYARA